MYGHVLLSFGNLFSTDMLFILVIALILFGGDKLPEIARGLGKGIRDFKDASEGIKREINDQINSYEEKRTETALNTQAAQHQLPANTDTSPGHPVVENTIPVYENHFTGTESVAAEHNGEARGHNGEIHDETVTGDHTTVQHADAGTVNEQSKN
jgi:sec-independent protein translocase protein TatA